MLTLKEAVVIFSPKIQEKTDKVKTKEGGGVEFVLEGEEGKT
jgi:hypothetical protein